MLEKGVEVGKGQVIACGSYLKGGGGGGQKEATPCICGGTLMATFRDATQT